MGYLEGGVHMSNNMAKISGWVLLAVLGLSCDCSDESPALSAPPSGNLQLTSLSGFSPDLGDTVQFEASVSGNTDTVSNYSWSVQDNDEEAHEFTTSGVQDEQISFSRCVPALP